MSGALPRTLRGAATRRAVLGVLLATSVAVTAGVVAVVRVTSVAETSAALVVPLLLLGLLALPAVGRELVLARRPEIAVARLRGAEVPQVVGLLATEPLVVLLAGAGLGLPAGLLVSRAAARAWLDADPGLVAGAAEVLALLVVVAGGLAGVLAGTAGVVREPLSDQVAGGRPGRAAGVGALFGGVLVVVAAVVATWASRESGGGAVSGGPVPLAAPALVGLLVGLAASGLLRLGARLAVRSAGARSTAWLLGARCLARDGTAGVRLLVASGVVAGIALSGAAAVDGWADESARLRAGAGLQVPWDGSAAAALGLTRRLDPAGRWLMAAVVAERGDGVSGRRAFLDTDRLEAVAGETLAGTGAASAVVLADALRASAPALVGAGDRVEVEAQARGLRGGTVALTVDYLAGGDFSASTELRLRVRGDGRVAGRTALLPGCSEGCTPRRLVVAPVPGARVPQLTLGAVRLGDRDLLDGEWRAEDSGAGGAPADDLGGTAEQRGVVPYPGGLGISSGLRRAVAVVPVSSRTALPLLATPAVRWPRAGDGEAGDGGPAEGEATVDGPGGEPRPARLAGRTPGLPLVEGAGVLGDLSAALSGSAPTVAGARVLVLARADTPADLLAALRGAAGVDGRDLAAVRDEVRDDSGSVRARASVLVALTAGVVALLSAVAPARRRRDARRAETAALRLLGVPLAARRSAARIEVVGRAVVVGAAVATGTLLAGWLLLADLPLVDVPATAVPLRTPVDPAAVLVAALGAAAATVLAAGSARPAWARRRVEAATRPALLREEVEG